MTKRLKIGIALVLALILPGVGALFFIDSIARAGIQAGVSSALGVKTTLSSAHIGLFSGQFSLGGLRVDNPPGCKTDHFLTLSRGELDVSLGSLLTQTLAVPRLELDGIDVSLERGGDGRSNYGVILDHVAAEDKGAKEAPAARAPEGGRKWIIREIRLKDIRATFTLFALGGSPQSIPVRIPELRLENVGADENGVNVARLSATLVQAIVAAAIREGGSRIPAEFGRDVARLAGALKQEAGKAAPAIESIKEGAGRAVQGIGDLFRKKK